MSSFSEPSLPPPPVRQFVYLDPRRRPAEPSPAPVAPLEPAARVIDEREVLEREQHARLEARRQAEAEWTAEQERQRAAERAALCDKLAQFDASRTRYFNQLEREVVQLALGIARKVLAREAQIDPLFLAGTVRVALDQLAQQTRVSLYVPPSALPAWEQWLQSAALAHAPQLLPDPALEPDGCRLEAETGNADFSPQRQLEVIERGFAELLERRALPA